MVHTVDAASASSSDASASELPEATSPWLIADEYAGYEKAVRWFAEWFPGWWVSGGACSVSCHCSIGVDRDGPVSHLLVHPVFDRGFDVDLRQPTTMASALYEAAAQAAEALASMATTDAAA